MKKLTSLASRPSWFGLLTLSLTSAGLLSGTAFAQKYQETNLVSDTGQSGVTTVDPDLVNPWGISRSSTGAWWAADQGKGVATHPSLSLRLQEAGSDRPRGCVGQAGNGTDGISLNDKPICPVSPILTKTPPRSIQNH